MTTRDNDVIISQCTPSGSGALALIRLSGDACLNVVDALAQLPSPKKLDHTKSHTIHYGWIVDTTGNQIDQVLFLVMRAPHTFTGQDTVEITCHNNPFIIQAIIEQAIIRGARHAEPGEFTKRAYLNKKIDLIQAEAVNELISAHTRQALQKSLGQLQGSLSKIIGSIEEQLLHAHALCQASFEFIEEENISFDEQIRTIISTTRQHIGTIKENYAQQKHIRDGVRIALIGAVNAGKSSLFNRLIKNNRAIVTPIAGTTRDAIESGVYRANTYATFIDTAGLRQTNNIIEKEGIKRSLDQAQQADLILLVIDSSRTYTAQERAIYSQLIERYREKIIIVANKCDLKSAFEPFEDMPIVAVSTITETNITALETAIAEKIKLLLGRGNAPYLVNKRHHETLAQVDHQLEKLQTMMAQNLQHEIVAIHLQTVLETLTELTGTSISHESMNAIFKTFCVGK